jgi:hypothetical protein
LRPPGVRLSLLVLWFTSGLYHVRSDDVEHPDHSVVKLIAMASAAGFQMLVMVDVNFDLGRGCCFSHTRF